MRPGTPLLFLTVMALAFVASIEAAIPRPMAAIRPLAMQRHRLAGNFNHYSVARPSFHPRSRRPMAYQLGGNIVTDTTIGGVHSFLQIYNIVLTVRILLSWFPNVARQPALGPIFVVTEPFFGLFRGLIPPIGGIDLSPLPAFLLLSWLTSTTETLGAELPSSKGSKKPSKTTTPIKTPFGRVTFPKIDLTPFRVHFGKDSRTGALA